MYVMTSFHFKILHTDQRWKRVWTSHGLVCSFQVKISQSNREEYEENLFFFPIKGLVTSLCLNRLKFKKRGIEAVSQVKVQRIDSLKESEKATTEAYQMSSTQREVANNLFFFSDKNIKMPLTVCSWHYYYLWCCTCPVTLLPLVPSIQKM